METRILHYGNRTVSIDQVSAVLIRIKSISTEGRLCQVMLCLFVGGPQGGALKESKNLYE